MLPLLPSTDVFQYAPDADGLDLWAEDFSPQMLPAKLGVYCFYDANTKEILYIGSACAQGVYKYGCGLFGRLQRYRRDRDDTSSTNKIKDERKKRRILVRFWITASAGDAAKCEQDTIEKYKPALNQTMAKRVQSVEERAGVIEKKKQEHRNRSQEELPPETDLYKCSDCGVVKQLLEFPKNISRKNGHNSVCKMCMAARWKAKKFVEVLPI